MTTVEWLRSTEGTNYLTSVPAGKLSAWRDRLAIFAGTPDADGERVIIAAALEAQIDKVIEKLTDEAEAEPCQLAGEIEAAA